MPNCRAYDWIFTDPPYAKEHLHTFETLAAIAKRHLKSGGSLLCMSGQSYLPGIYEILNEALDYHWTLTYFMPGDQATQIFPRKVNTFWKPILWYTKGQCGMDTWVGDVTSSAANDNDKTQHHWGQSVSGMHDLMARFVKPGDTVLDPFMGGGTTGEVALMLKAKFIGYEIDEDHFNQSKVRLAACLQKCGANDEEREYFEI